MLVRKIASTPAAKSLYSVELQPGSTVQTDDDFRTFVESNYMPVFHPIGTAPMLPRSLGGVVDSNLKVYGVQGVRVVGKLFYNLVTTMALALRYVCYGRCFYNSNSAFSSSFIYCIWYSGKGLLKCHVSISTSINCHLPRPLIY